MIRMTDLSDQAAEQYRIKAARILGGQLTNSASAVSRMAELIATVEDQNDSLTVLRQQAGDNNEMIWRLKGEVSRLKKKVLDSET